MKDEEQQELGQDLLPGWSALVVMLTIFGALAVITLLTLLHGEDDHFGPEVGGRIAYGPADFPDAGSKTPVRRRKSERSRFRLHRFPTNTSSRARIVTPIWNPTPNAESSSICTTTSC